MNIAYIEPGLKLVALFVGGAGVTLVEFIIVLVEFFRFKVSTPNVELKLSTLLSLVRFFGDGMALLLLFLVELIQLKGLKALKDGTGM